MTDAPKDNVVALPGVDRTAAPGVPRHDMAKALRDIADRAEKGEIVALVATFALSKESGRMGFTISTPENAYYSILGALEELKMNVMERCPDEDNQNEADYD